MRFLIVDDDPKNRKLLEVFLNRFGECKSVEGGKEAIMAFEQAWNEWRPFSLIFLDIMMPEMDGEKVLVNIREIEQNKNVYIHHRVKIVMVTAHSDEELFKRCVQCGCDDYIVKPFDKDTLIRKLLRLGFNDIVRNCG
jgi:two-component system chemotaxis response regulator CheY